MDFARLLDVFQGVTTLLHAPATIIAARLGLVLLGMALVYLGKKGTLEPLLMIPMGLGMIAVNAGVLLMDVSTSRTVQEARVFEVMLTAADGRTESATLRLKDDQSWTLTPLAENSLLDGWTLPAPPAAATYVQEGHQGVGAVHGQAVGQDQRVLRLEGSTAQAKPDQPFAFSGQLILTQADGGTRVFQAQGAETRAPGTLFVAPLVQRTDNLMTMLQIDFLQPVYSLTFSNGLIACLVFMGIGVLLDVGFLLARPIESMFLALCAELGTVLTFPIAVGLGLTYGQAASVAMIGGADGPMVMFTSLSLAKELFVPITVVGYLYLGLTYGGYPYLIKLLVPARYRAIRTAKKDPLPVTSNEKLAFAVLACAVLCFLFPVAAPLFLSLFVGVAVKEAELKPFVDFIGGPVLYGATFFLGLMLGVLCEAGTILDPTVLKLLLLGILALIFSGIGGILGGYALCFLRKGNYNPVIGIAGVSCVPTCAKVAQKIVQHDAPGELILPEALGANISGVITSAIFCGVYVSIVPLLK